MRDRFARRAVVAGVLGFVLSAVGAAATAQQYPAKPIRFIVAGAAGTSLDTTARYFAEQMTKRMNASIVVDNRPGAGGLIASEFVAKASADGYTVLVQGIPLYTYRWLSETPLTFDPVGDLIPTARVISVPLAIYVPANSPYKTLPDLVRAMRARPGEINYATGGSGSTSHLCTIALLDQTQTSARHVPYKGNTAAVTDVASGQVDFSCQSPAAVPLVKEGRMRVLAVTNRSRWSSLPDVPTVAETVIPGFDFVGWSAMFLRAGTPPEIVQKLSDEFVQVARAGAFRDYAEKNSSEVDIQDHKQFTSEAPKNEAFWKRISQIAKGS